MKFQLKTHPIPIIKTIKMNPLLHSNLFPEICKHLKFREFIKLEQLSKFHKDIIRNHKWFHVFVRLNDETLHVLKMYKFMRLNLSKTNVTNEDIKMLKYCRVIMLNICTNITDEGVKELKKCRSVCLANTNITDESVKELKNCHALNLSKCKNITDESVKELKNCHALNLSRCKNITDESVKELKNVRRLNLAHTNITNEGIKELKNWSRLNLDGCDNITNVDIIKSNERCQRSYLYLGKQNKITEECKKKLIECNVKIIISYM